MFNNQFHKSLQQLELDLTTLWNGLVAIFHRQLAPEPGLHFWEAPKAAIKGARAQVSLILLLCVDSGSTNSSTQHGAVVKLPRHIITNKCNWELCRWLSNNFAVSRTWKLTQGRFAELGFRDLLVDDYWDDQKGFSFWQHKEGNKGHWDLT